MNNEAIIMVFCAVAGGFSLLASVFNWDFFFNSRQASFFMDLFGRKGTRVFYGILGLLLIGVATKALLDMN